jgi:hypothetical protein
LVNFHPHVHALAAEGVFRADGAFVALPAIPQALLCKHIPERYEQLVRYCGWYSSRSRGLRKAKDACAGTAPGAATEVLGEYASRAKAAWRGSSARSMKPIRCNARSARARCR